MDIEVKDLEDDFSNVFAKVLDGQVIQVTRLGIPIALIQPIQSGIPAQFLDKDLVSLPVRTGPIGLGTRFRSVQTTSEALQEDRGA